MAKPKPNALAAAFKQVDVAEAVPKPSTRRKTTAPPKSDASKRKDRANTVMVGGHFPPEVKQALRILAAEENTTSQALLGEALNLLFVKKGKGRLV